MWSKVTTFFKEVRGEFARVIWPTREELVSSTSVVIAFSLAFAAFIGVFDLVISFIWRVFLGQ
jgi:preprotein translocase subunit SecE